MPGTRVELQVGHERYYAVAARTFADARPGDIILYEDAYRNISIAINGGNAAAMFGITEGQDIRIHLGHVVNRRGARPEVRAARDERRHAQPATLAVCSAR